MRDSLCEAPTAARLPDRQGARRSRKSSAFPEAQCDACGDERAQAPDQTRAHGRRADYETRQPQNATWAESIASPASDELKEGIWVGERRDGQAELSIAEP